MMEAVASPEVGSANPPGVSRAKPLVLRLRGWAHCHRQPVPQKSGKPLSGPGQAPEVPYWVKARLARPTSTESTDSLLTVGTPKEHSPMWLTISPMLH